MKPHTYIYMNHHIRAAKPRHPVIDAMVPGSVVVSANAFEIVQDGRVLARVVYDPANNPSPTHEVKAWVEVMQGASVRRADGRS